MTRFISERPFITTDDIVVLASHIVCSEEQDLRIALSEVGIDPNGEDLHAIADELWRRFRVSVLV